MIQEIPIQTVTAAIRNVLPEMPMILRRIVRSMESVASMIKGTRRTSTLMFPGRFSVPPNQRQTSVARRAPMTETTVRSIDSSGNL